jgi:hypothetical protein
VVIYFRDNVYIIKTLKEFQYVDEDGKDQGANVRQKAKDITNLLQDESRLREERRARASMRDRMIRGAGESAGDGDGDGEGEGEDENESRRRRQGNGAPTGSLNGIRPNRDEDELRKAIEESKRTLAAEQVSAEERDLQQAIRMSEEEEAKRKNAVEDTNASALFDDQNQLYDLLSYLTCFRVSIDHPCYHIVQRRTATTPSLSVTLRHTRLAFSHNLHRSNLNSRKCNPNSRRSTLTNSKPSKRLHRYKSRVTCFPRRSNDK